MLYVVCFHENVAFKKLRLWTYSGKNTHEILLVIFFPAKELLDMSKEALEMQDKKHIHEASVPKVHIFIMRHVNLHFISLERPV